MSKKKKNLESRLRAQTRVRKKLTLALKIISGRISKWEVDKLMYVQLGYTPEYIRSFPRDCPMHNISRVKAIAEEIIETAFMYLFTHDESYLNYLEKQK